MAGKKKVEGSIIAYKAFDRNLQCLGFQYEVGKTYHHDGDVVHCRSGFHSCENPLDVLNYYGICDDIRFAKVEASGTISREGGGDTKIASASLHVQAELTLPDFIAAAISWVKSACKVSVDGNASSGHSATNASSGHSATNASSGHSATNASSGRYATNASSGDSAKNASSGHSATNASSGHSATNASSGDSATNASSGDSAKNASSGHSATNASSGRYATNEATGKHSVISGAGRETLAKGAKGVWVSLADYELVDGEWRCCGFATGQCGHDGIPVDTWLKAKNGKLVPA